MKTKELIKSTKKLGMTKEEIITAALQRGWIWHDGYLTYIVRNHSVIRRYRIIFTWLYVFIEIRKVTLAGEFTWKVYGDCSVRYKKFIPEILELWTEKK